MRCNMARATYSDETKTRAVALYLEHGPAEAARRMEAEGTKIPQGTIRAWASHGDVATTRLENLHANTDALKATAEERRARLADRMLDLAEMATDHAAQLIGDASLRDVVGLFTRAVHDHELLSGRATTRTEHTTAETIHAVADEVAARRAKRDAA